MIKKLINVFGIFFEDFTQILNLLQSTEKACKQKNELNLNLEKAH